MNEYNKVKEIVNEDVYIVTYTKKERKCDICSCIKLSKDITIIKKKEKCNSLYLMNPRCNNPAHLTNKAGNY